MSSTMMASFTRTVRPCCCSHESTSTSKRTLTPFLSSSFRTNGTRFTVPRGDIHRPCSRALIAILSPQRKNVIAQAAMSGTADAARCKVGFCGIGIMGLPMASNLIKAGYDVTVWNRSAEKCQPLKEAGAKVAESPQAVAEQTDVIVAMLADPKAAQEVAKSIAKGISEGKGYVDVSTIDGGTAEGIKEVIHKSGGRYLEAPVSGSKQPAEQGSLIFLCAGDEDLFRYASPLLDVMGKAKFFLGEVGNGANMKLVVNMVMGTMMASFAEGLALAEKAGLSQEDFIEVSGLGAIAAPMFAMKVMHVADLHLRTVWFNGKGQEQYWPRSLQE